MRRQPVQARAAFEAALKSDANFGPAQLDLAETLIEAGDVRNAIPWLERASQSTSPGVAQRARELEAQIHSSN